MSGPTPTNSSAVHPPSAGQGEAFGPQADIEFARSLEARILAMESPAYAAEHWDSGSAAVKEAAMWVALSVLLFVMTALIYLP